jgi:uncharacterized membrane protein HdeD (DUF308 family)
MTKQIDRIYRLAHHAVWDYIFTRGLLALVIGIIFVSMPASATTFICILLAVFLLINGITALVKSMKGDYNKNSLLVYGLICLIAGLIVLMQPIIAKVGLVWIFALWVLIAGINQFINASKSKNIPMSARILTALTGLLSIILGIALLLNPKIGLEVIVVVIGIYFLIFGIISILIGALMHRTSKQRIG